MIEELAQGPLAVSFRSDKRTLQAYKGGFWDPPPLDDTPSDGFVAPTHSALLVGYGEDPQEGSYWILQNHWGAAWGEAGSFKVRRDVARERGLETLVVAADVIPDERPQVLDDFTARFAGAVATAAPMAVGDTSLQPHSGAGSVDDDAKDENDIKFGVSSARDPA